MKKKSIYFSCLLLGCFASLFLATYWLNKNADTSTKKQLVSSSSSVPKFPYTSPNDPCFKHQWNLNSREGINVQSAWKLSSGENITIAVIDTGVAWVKDLSEDRFVPGKDYLTDESTGDDIGDDILTPQESEDSKIHGTFGTAIMAASTNNGIACAGIAYKSKVMPLRVLDGDNEPEKYEHIAEAIKFAVNNKADIINLSIEIHENDPSIKKAIEYAYKNNVVIVAAAGNQGQKKVLYPAFYKGVIAVGAYNKKGEIASYSNYSKDINIYAPGGSIQKEQCQELEWKSDSNIPEWASNGIVQLILRKTTQGNQIYKLGVCDGTSQATAHVTGVVALVKAILKPKG